ncbi:DUF6456 domain-containing protein [Sulfitobacter aestuarii]|uniref:DUF6456 domain-containing protein n=1 Tax=Sulfitobacter aestuarii TaxID=2161676 RepID=A0ABW5U098_9RHOB
MPSETCFSAPLPRVLPSWVPRGAKHYLAHTEDGEAIRALARDAGCHASTILRQIRRIEMRRDDPLVDAALCSLGLSKRGTIRRQSADPAQRKPIAMGPVTPLPDDATLWRESLRVLRRLCESGAVLAVAAEMEKAVVVRDAARGGGTRTAVVDRAVAQAMALKDWIASSGSGRIIRYQITSAGRAALAQMLEKDCALAAELDEPPGSGEGALDLPDQAESGGGRRQRYSLGDSPLTVLARRREKGGAPFLSAALVHAGERLREDFELGQTGPRVTQDWDRFLSGAAKGRAGPASGPDAASQARARVAAALAELGPGLSDVVLRCCCYLEGLEAAEKRLGWSARSGKIVLRIALMRLKRHYDETVGPGGPLIG